MLTAEMKAIILNHAAGFLATTTSDGQPRVSPKGTMLTRGDDEILFSDLRSPGSLKNLSERPDYEINFLDVLSRKAVRARGQAKIFQSDSPEYQAALPLFQARWPELVDSIRAIVCLKVHEASLILSPSYDIGETEESLRASNAQYYASLT